MKKKLLITGLLLESLIAASGDISKDDINKQLEKIAEEPAPAKLAPGAMCYEIAAPPNRIEYHCPKCKTKVLLDHNSAPMRGFIKIEQIRSWADELRKLGLDCKIDESDFCPKCSKDKVFDKEHPRALYWIITVDKREVRNKVQSFDYQLLRAFMKKELKVKTSTGREEPIKKYLPRLRQLLGLTDKERKK
jgi:hypothetical protein